LSVNWGGFALQKNKGFTLIETIVSLLLLSIIVLGFFNTYFSVNKLNDHANQKRLAYQLCQEVLIKIDQEKIPIKKGKINYDKFELKNLNIENYSQYQYIDKLIITSDPLRIEKQTVKDLFIVQLQARWDEHKMSLTTIARGGEVN